MNNKNDSPEELIRQLAVYLEKNKSASSYSSNFEELVNRLSLHTHKKEVSQGYSPPSSESTPPLSVKNFDDSESKSLNPNIKWKRVSTFDPRSFVSTASNKSTLNFEESIEAISRQYQDLKNDIKTSNISLDDKVKKLEAKINNVEDNIKSISIKHIEILGVFSAILALIISGVTIASNGLYAASSCIILGLTAAIMLLFISCIDDIVNSRKLFTSARYIAMSTLIVIIISLGFIYTINFEQKNTAHNISSEVDKHENLTIQRNNALSLSVQRKDGINDIGSNSSN